MNFGEAVERGRYRVALDSCDLDGEATRGTGSACTLSFAGVKIPATSSIACLRDKNPSIASDNRTRRALRSCASLIPERNNDPPASHSRIAGRGLFCRILFSGLAVFYMHRPGTGPCVGAAQSHAHLCGRS